MHVITFKAFFLVFLTLFLNLFYPNKTKANTNSEEVKITATIGEPKLKIFGFAPSLSTVKLTGVGISDQTTADKNGFFVFEKVYLPTNYIINDKSSYPEICLQASDESKASSSPVCLPQLPASQIAYEVGPVLLSPILIIEKNKIIKGEQVLAFGKTTPNTAVSIHLAREDKNFSLASLLAKEAKAFFIPEYKIFSNEEGYFEFNLPTNQINSWRVFTFSESNQARSPRSNTLNFKVLPPYFSFIELLGKMLSTLQPYLIYFIIMMLFLIAFYLLYQLLKLNDSNKNLSEHSGESLLNRQKP